MFKPQVMNRYNVYKKGRQLIGVASEVTLPEVTNLTDTLEGARNRRDYGDSGDRSD